MKVDELMRTNVLTVAPDTPLRKVNEMLHHFLSDYVIVTEGKKALGIATYSDLFKQLLPSYEEVMEDETYWLNPESMESRASALVQKPVSQVMTKNLITTWPEMPLVEVGALMTAKKVKQLPVLENGELVGVISFRDITWGFLLRPKH